MKDLHKYLTRIPHFIKLPSGQFMVKEEEALIINIKKISCIMKGGPELTYVFLDTGSSGNSAFRVEISLPQNKVQEIIELAHQGFY